MTTVTLRRLHTGAAYQPLTAFGDVSDVRVVWRAIGGAWEMECTVTARGDNDAALRSSAPGWLGQYIYHLPSGWHGIAAEVVVRYGYTEYTYTLADYANRVAVAGKTFISAWSQSLQQQALYGTWEHIENGGDITPTAAGTMADRLLAERRGRILARADVDLTEFVTPARVTVYAIGRLWACRRFATNWYRGSDAIGYEALDVAKTTLGANEPGGETSLAVASESAFSATDAVAVSMNDGTFHWDEVASTSSGVVVITDGLPGPAAETAASSSQRLALGQIAVSTWLTGVIGDTDLTAGEIATNSTEAPIAEYANLTDAWSLMEALAGHGGTRAYTLDYDAAGFVHYRSIGTGATPQYQIMPSGAVKRYLGGIVSQWQARPGWYQDPTQGQTLYVEEVEYTDGRSEPTLRATAIYQAA